MGFEPSRAGKTENTGSQSYTSWVPGWIGKNATKPPADSVSKHLRHLNTQDYYDFLITANADQLGYFRTKDNFEGSDEAAKFYQRNLRMYDNFLQVPVSQNDRVFILMGAAHTAFFQDFIRRSPQYQTVNVSDYLP